MLRLMNYFWIFSFVMIFGGCFGKVSQVQYYELEALGVSYESNYQNNAGSKKDLRGSKERFFAWEISVSPKISGKKIAYKNNANSISYFSKNAWIESFPIVLNSLAQKIAGNYGIWNDINSTERVKIHVLDCYFDAQNDLVFVRFLVESSKGNTFMVKTESVESGGFIKIIEGFERVLNAAFTEIFMEFR